VDIGANHYYFIARLMISIYRDCISIPLASDYSGDRSLGGGGLQRSHNPSARSGGDGQGHRPVGATGKKGGA